MYKKTKKSSKIKDFSRVINKILITLFGPQKANELNRTKINKKSLYYCNELNKKRQAGKKQKKRGE